MGTKTIPKLKTNPKYNDAPRFSLIYAYEEQMKKSYKDRTKETVILLGSAMKKMLIRKA